MSIEAIYKEIKRPENLVLHFKDDKEFIQWVEEGTNLDIFHATKAFLEADQYRYAIMMLDVVIKREKAKQ